MKFLTSIAPTKYVHGTYLVGAIEGGTCSQTTVAHACLHVHTGARSQSCHPIRKPPSILDLSLLTKLMLQIQYYHYHQKKNVLLPLSPN